MYNTHIYCMQTGAFARGGSAQTAGWGVCTDTRTAPLAHRKPTNAKRQQIRNASALYYTSTGDLFMKCKETQKDVLERMQSPKKTSKRPLAPKPANSWRQPQGSLGKGPLSYNSHSSQTNKTPRRSNQRWLAS